MSKSIIKIEKRGDGHSYIHNEIVDSIGNLTVECPECRHYIYDDPQYQCVTCGGGARIHVLDWINEQLKNVKDV